MREHLAQVKTLREEMNLLSSRVARALHDPATKQTETDQGATWQQQPVGHSRWSDHSRFRGERVPDGQGGSRTADAEAHAASVETAPRIIALSLQIHLVHLFVTRPHPLASFVDRDLLQAFAFKQTTALSTEEEGLRSPMETAWLYACVAIAATQLSCREAQQFEIGAGSDLCALVQKLWHHSKSIALPLVEDHLHRQEQYQQQISSSAQDPADALTLFEVILLHILLARSICESSSAAKQHELSVELARHLLRLTLIEPRQIARRAQLIRSHAFLTWTAFEIYLPSETPTATQQQQRERGRQRISASVSLEEMTQSGALNPDGHRHEEGDAVEGEAGAGEFSNIAFCIAFFSLRLEEQVREAETREAILSQSASVHSALDLIEARIEQFRSMGQQEQLVGDRGAAAVADGNGERRETVERHAKRARWLQLETDLLRLKLFRREFQHLVQEDKADLPPHHEAAKKKQQCVQICFELCLRALHLGSELCHVPDAQEDELNKPDGFDAPLPLLLPMSRVALFAQVLLEGLTPIHSAAHRHSDDVQSNAGRSTKMAETAHSQAESMVLALLGAGPTPTTAASIASTAIERARNNALGAQIPLEKIEQLRSLVEIFVQSLADFAREESGLAGRRLALHRAGLLR